MSDGNIYLAEKKWKVTKERWKEIYPISYDLSMKISKRTIELFKKVSPYYGEKLVSSFFIDENGNLHSNEIFVFLIGAIGEITQQETTTLIKKGIEEQNKELIEIKNELGKIQRFLKYAIPELEDLIECPYCKEYNPPDASYCIRCTKKITMEESDEKDK